MTNRKYRRFYVISLAILLALSAYPLINGARMAALSLANGAIEPGQYAKYVVPYAAICFSLVLFAALQPLYFKLGRLALPAGMAAAYGVFLAAEQFMEKIQIRAAGMVRIDPADLPAGFQAQASAVPPGTVDIWQASLCVVSPMTKGQSGVFVSGDSYIYAMADNSYKLHYYFISAVLIAMAAGLIYGIGRLCRAGGSPKPLVLQGASAAVLIFICVFANLTGFYRQAEPIQTPLASALTCLFFVLLGASSGVYAGSLLLKGNKRLYLALPVLVSVLVSIMTYVGEAVMMRGELYRFGTGWLFDGFPGISLAPIDILVIMLSGASSLAVLRLARKKED